MEVARRSFQAAVSQQDLDGAQIRARLQQMGSEAVAKRMWADLLGDSSSADGIPKNREDGVITDRFVGSFAGEEPFLRLFMPPVLPEGIQQNGGQHHHSILLPFTLMDGDGHAC